MNNEYGVHISHCCFKHGCKYGEEDCPVVAGKVEQLYTCETCDDYGIKSVEDLHNTKLICSCGNELIFKIVHKDLIDENGSVHTRTIGSFDISAEHDKIWIGCNKCNKSIYTNT